MPIHLDDQPLDAPTDTLAAVLEHAQQQLAEAGRVVVDIQVNGEALAGETLDARLDQPVGDADVRLGSAKPSELAAEALSGVRDQLGEARVLQAEAADLLQRDQPAEALQKVLAAIDAWLNTQQAVVQGATMLDIDLNEFSVDDQDVTETVHELATQLNELKELITSGDMVGLADALAYEWPEVTDRWDGLLGALLEKAEG